MEPKPIVPASDSQRNENCLPLTLFYAQTFRLKVTKVIRERTAYKPQFARHSFRSTTHNRGKFMQPAHILPEIAPHKSLSRKTNETHHGTQ